MQRSFWICIAAVSLLELAACKARRPDPEYRPTATVKDIMDSMVDPSADFLWDSVATIISAAGVEERMPRTDQEWTDVHRAAVRLVEATNLLLMGGRHVARPGEKSENPDVELEPEEIEKRINDDRAAWIRLAYGLHDAAMPALRATEVRDAKALFETGDKIDIACENCHLKYWYPPNSTKTPTSLRSKGAQ